jgi:nicotinamide-nucleotide amidase
VKVATLSIGDELTHGEIVDTNAVHIAGRLYRDGLKLQRHLTVGDNELDIVEALELLADKADAVIATGGLGPTVDDITARAAARLTGRRLMLNDEALAHLKRFMGVQDGPLLVLNEKQALLPTKCTVVPNPTGTACGFMVIHNGRFLFFLPGVPSEMKRMLDETVLPFLLERRRSHRFVGTRVLKTFGLAEAELDDLLKGMATPEISVGFCVSFPEIMVKLRAEGESGEHLDWLLANAAAAVQEKLKGHVYGEEDDTIDTVVAGLFRETGQTLSLAESCTGGMIAARITSQPGSSAWFREGMVTYSNEAKSRLLGVPPDLIASHGAVSSEVARAMAKGALQSSGGDIALAVTGIAGPDGGTPEKPVGTVYIALASRAGCHAKGYRFSGGRDEVRVLTAFTAMDWLRRHLQSRSSAPPAGGTAQVS